MSFIAAGLPPEKHSALKMDEALLTVNNELVTDVVVSWRSERCYQVGSYCKCVPSVGSVELRLDSLE